MKHRRLQEIAKFATGLVAADLLAMLWFYYQNLFPVKFLGATWDSSMVLPGVVFDIALLLILIHYAWNLGKIPRLKERGYLLIAGVIFTVVAAAHILRLFMSADIVLMGWVVPLWLSWVGTLVAAYLAYMSFRLATRLS